MSIDPVDDRTVWSTGQGLKADGTFNWSTWIASLGIQGCLKARPRGPRLCGLGAFGPAIGNQRWHRCLPRWLRR